MNRHHDSAANPGSEGKPAARLQQAWVELTTLCNLECGHCYNASGPSEPLRQISADTFRSTVTQVCQVGAQTLQFIGGEPTLVPELPELIEQARTAGTVERVEVFTNGYLLSDDMLQVFVQNRVDVAVSLYSDRPEEHDQMTTRPGSWKRTVANIRRMQDAGLSVRIAITVPEGENERAERTIEFVKRELGIEVPRADFVRAFGRGEDLSGRDTGLQELCGECWRDKVVILPNGDVSCCIMSRDHLVGNVQQQPLGDILDGVPMKVLQEHIRHQVWEPRQQDGDGLEAYCQPTDRQWCGPKEGVCGPPCGPACSPHLCMPQTGPCYPQSK